MLAPKITKLCFRQNVTREKLREALSHSEHARKLLMKLTPGMLALKNVLFTI